MKDLKPNLGICQECGKNVAEWTDLKFGVPHNVCVSCARKGYNEAETKKCSGKRSTKRDSPHDQE